MTPGPLAQALEAEADHRPASDDVDAVTERARRRALRGRRMRLLIWGAGGLALVVAAALALRTMDLGAEPPSPVAAPPAPTLYAEDLIGTVVERARGVDPARAAQAAVLCSVREGRNPWSSAEDVGVIEKACSAGWAADGPLIEVATDATDVRVSVGGGHAIVTVAWAVRNTGAAPLELDTAGVLISLTTDPDQVATDHRFGDHQYAGTSLWASNTQRFAALSGGARPVEVAPGGLVRGTTVFEATMPSAGARRDPVWDIAAGAEPTLGIQIRSQPFGLSTTRELFLETETTLADAGPGATADALVAGFTSRSPGEVRTGAQAVLLCEVPEHLRARASSDASRPYTWVEASCEPGWIPRVVLRDAGSLTLTQRGVAPSADWEVLNASGMTVQAADWQVVVEPRPESSRDDGESLALLGRTVVSRTSAWQADGTRAVLLDTTRMNRVVRAGESIDGHDPLFPGLLTSDEPIDVDAVVRAIRGGGTTTLQTMVPFLTDRSRVLVLETPLDYAGDSSLAPE